MHYKYAVKTTTHGQKKNRNVLLFINIYSLQNIIIKLGRYLSFENFCHFD